MHSLTLYDLCRIFSIQPIDKWWNKYMHQKAKHILIEAPYLETNRKVILESKDEEGL